jgi:hypothetical protein
MLGKHLIPHRRDRHTGTPAKSSLVACWPAISKAPSAPRPDSHQPAPIERPELYASLPDKAEGYGYLRDVQGQVLTAWHKRRDERDLIKVNTGAGKTIDGLGILRSYGND